MGPRGKLAADTPIHRLKMTLEEVEPPVWRSVLVPSTLTLARLHSVIQAAMGWTDSHLYEFEFGGSRYASDDEDNDDELGPPPLTTPARPPSPTCRPLPFRSFTATTSATTGSTA